MFQAPETDHLYREIITQIQILAPDIQSTEKAEEAAQNLVGFVRVLYHADQEQNEKESDK